MKNLSMAENALVNHTICVCYALEEYRQEEGTNDTVRGHADEARFWLDQYRDHKSKES